jgi:hypothetical protein
MMVMINIKQIVNGNKVFFDSYRQGYFYYKVGVPTENGLEAYQFPVPLEDIGTATMLAEDKAITFMRWIRKAMEDKTFIRV